VDWVYMLSMLLIGLALTLGIGTRLAASGIIWMGLFYTAGVIWLENNPFLDDHVVYAIVLAGIAYVAAGRTVHGTREVLGEGLAPQAVPHPEVAHIGIDPKAGALAPPSASGQRKRDDSPSAQEASMWRRTIWRMPPCR
jgi:uncharacterized membrane protein YedE/YeeE